MCFASYIIYDLTGVEEYMMSANVSVCYEPDSCVFTDIVLVDVRFPKPNCNYKSSDYNMPGIFIYIYIYSCYSIWRTVVTVNLFFSKFFFYEEVIVLLGHLINFFRIFINVMVS